MLILTRRIGEGVIIGDEVRVVVLEVRGKQVRLGIEAPTEVVVLRDEIFQRLHQQNLQASQFLFHDFNEFKRSVNGRIKWVSQPDDPPGQGSEIVINNPQLGSFQVGENQIITFDHGLLGFGDFHRFALLAPSETAPFSLLQCLEQPEVSFLLTDPASLVDRLNLGRLNSALHELEARSLEDLQVFITLTIPPGRPTEATANLVSPILINRSALLGKQVILENQHYSHKQRILSDA